MRSKKRKGFSIKFIMFLYFNNYNLPLLKFQFVQYSGEIFRNVITIVKVLKGYKKLIAFKPWFSARNNCQPFVSYLDPAIKAAAQNLTMKHPVPLRSTNENRSIDFAFIEFSIFEKKREFLCVLATAKEWYPCYVRACQEPLLALFLILVGFLS